MTASISDCNSVLPTTSAGKSAIAFSISATWDSTAATESWTVLNSSSVTTPSAAAFSSASTRSSRTPTPASKSSNLSGNWATRNHNGSLTSTNSPPVVPPDEEPPEDDPPGAVATTRCGKYLPIDKRGDIAARVDVTAPDVVADVVDVFALDVALVVDGKTRIAPARVDAPDVLDAAALDALVYVPAPPRLRTGAADIAGVATTVHNAQINARLDIFNSVFMSSLYLCI